MLDLLLESAMRSLALGGAVWLGLVLLRVRNPRAQMTAWTVVLVASLSMPALMHRLTVTVPAAAPSLRVVESIAAFSGPLADLADVSAPSMQAPLALPPAAQPAAGRLWHDTTPVRAVPRDSAGFGWRAPAAAIYLVVAGVLLLRLLIGLLLSWGMARAARPLHEGWTGHADVRVSDSIGMPVTFGSTILLPAEYADWSEEKRQAVLSHERAHVAHGDFYVLLLAAFNRAVFWFNPLTWWQLIRMAELAEIISDDAALEMLEDRPSYAGILLDLAGGPQDASVAIAMARACTLRKRIERILAETRVPVHMGWRKRALVAIALVPTVMVSAGSVVPDTLKPSAEVVAVVPGALPPHDDAAGAEPHSLDRYAGFYELAPLRALAVTRADDHLILHETGRLKFKATMNGDSEFVSSDTGASVTFRSDDMGRTNELVLHEPGSRARRAFRIDTGRAQAIENAFAHRVAVAPDRFKEQVPAGGSKAAVLRAVEELQREAPSYERIIEQLPDNARGQIVELHDMIRALGAIEAVFFRGVGPGGYDIYGAKFANGFAEFRILVGPGGNIEDIVFRPDGDDTPGAAVSCSLEQTLKSVPDTAPIRLLLYNRSGADIHVFALDFGGKRSRSVTIGHDQIAPILTSIGHPWVVADSSGQCVEIIMPGRSTRFVAIAPDTREKIARSAPRRTSPLPDSEQALRQYIDALGRGEPNYGAMTPQVAAYTRQQLLLNQAILQKLGALRAISFRGVTSLDSDIYVVHFANGSAEWRIGLANEGRIGLIALGPQY